MVADLPALIKVPGSFPSISTEILHLYFSSSPKVSAGFSLSVEANVSSILNVQFSDVEKSGCACGFCATILMCNYPNVQVSSCAYSRMGKIPCASFRCASPRCAFLLAPNFRFWRGLNAFQQFPRVDPIPLIDTFLAREILDVSQ